MIMMEWLSVHCSRKTNVNKNQVSQQASCMLRVDMDLGGISIMLRPMRWHIMITCSIFYELANREMIMSAF